LLLFRLFFRYSAYGFNAKGYDQDNCNYYNEGPHYMRFFFFGLMQLQNLPREALQRITRICSPITPLPQVAVTQWWLGDVSVNIRCISWCSFAGVKWRSALR